MKEVVLVFPGQGSQYIGMGENLSDSTLFDKANEVLDYDLKSLCLNGPEDELKKTQNTQPAILTHSIALFQELIKRKELNITKVLGHSVGEFAALVAAGSISFEQAVKAVHLRGQYMQEAVPHGIGGMTAILKLSSDIVDQACEAASTEHEQVVVANYNSPMQLVISGHLEAIARAENWLKENSEQRFRAMTLPVSAPFHSPLMEPAAAKLKKHFETMDFKPNDISYVANIDAKEYAQGTNIESLKSNLTLQVSSSVLWIQSLNLISENSIIIEVGPGKVLKGLIKKTRPELEVYSIDDDGFEFLEDL